MTTPTSPTPAAAPSGPGRLRLLIALAVGAVAVVALLLVALLSGATEHLVEVPAGYGARAEAGEDVEALLPDLFSVAVGDTLRVVNDDDQVHQIGPYTVGPGDTIQQTFTTPGRIEGICTVHPEGEIAILVR